MRLSLAAAALLLTTSSAALAAHPGEELDGRIHAGLSQDPPGPGSVPLPKEKLLVPPAGAQHFVVVSDSAKHGDAWLWDQPDGSRAGRFSMSLRGWITETDGVVRLNQAGFPASLVVRGVSPEGDAAETMSVGPDGVATWKAAADSGSAPLTGFYVDNGAPPFLMEAALGAALRKSGAAGVPLLPVGRAFLEQTGVSATVQGPGGPKTLRLVQTRGFGMAPSSSWVDEKGEPWGSVGWISFVPAGYEEAPKVLRPIQRDYERSQVTAVAAKFLDPVNRAPVLFDNVTLFDADGGRFVPGQAVLVQDGKIARIGRAGSLKAPAGARSIDGAGKSLVPGLWDAHRHAGSERALIGNLATGIVNYRSPGSSIEDAERLMAAQKAGTLLGGEGWFQAIVDRKDPLAAQGATTVSSAAEAVEAVRMIKAKGLWGVKFYTSMDPAWIAPAAAEAKKLGLHVNGHVPARMRPLEAVRAGYDELTHINFVVMQLMPQAVVDKANTAARIEGPAKYARSLDLNSAEAHAMLAELKRKGTWVDPSLVVFESTLVADGGTPQAPVAAYADSVPPLVARGFRASGHPLIENLTRDDYRKSFAKLVELTGALHKASVPIVAGTDGEGRELVRELELYEQGGLSKAAALQTATINPARLVGAEARTGSIAVGKEADLILVDGDVSKDLGALRRVLTVVSNGVVMDGDALRQAAGYTGRPK
ncbi:imidazolonepropionase-like amidohydrolase [Sphingomonas kaistensis]|uniref:Imidazolonepropionase-like amidohydrolase n=1 Tax=Sphingomonas kaistensis TaxID=298708 RepID=A0A7X5Y8J3_9SPHN|nr:amidohydrolase family protein [Sphingomonas kaistensis]NJC06976.1 imidazolonepropionase-like amidohydrolase [Sphingomonas kaistensis]